MTNGDFFCIETFSGYRTAVRDPQGRQYLLSPDATDDALGEALLAALAASRFLTLQDAQLLTDFDASSRRYAEWVNNLMGRYGYKTRRALFKSMKSCWVEEEGASISIRPTHHEKLEGWSGEGIAPGDYVVVPSDSAAAFVGAALRVAFNRCTE
ncbi:MAG: contact-dependent growth inhibition system immunity protein [Thermoanaerobaculaceae bacterium]